MTKESASARIDALTEEIETLIQERDRKIAELQKTTAQAVKALRAQRASLKKECDYYNTYTPKVAKENTVVHQMFGKKCSELTEDELREYNRTIQKAYRSSLS